MQNIYTLHTIVSSEASSSQAISSGFAEISPLPPFAKSGITALPPHFKDFLKFIQQRRLSDALEILEQRGLGGDLALLFVNSAQDFLGE